MGLSVEEQETTVSFSRDTDKCTVYTSDRTVMTKLDKFVKNEGAPHWKLKEVHRTQGGEIVAKTYETHKKLIHFKADITTREMTDEQREAAAERMRKMHNGK